ncbi:hypothetical protein [Planctomycetes bacterium K23_9]|uniref:Uncharacterized protein n=1 Tax=Stieleria marina TaxID=1930275 RepID=A0A517P0Y8_9BACT|nr:hypothetical protein K239x_50560 [Planctomycetes bacterium K23_9]
MGGLLVLLAVAATSVTFGWQPDGTGGVEYLVQVSPDKLAQVRQTGEITSTIPSEIQGHVSRVVIRVGDGPLPRTISSSMQRQAEANRLSQADRQNVPIPQIGSTDSVERVMKPQNTFSFPDAATRAGDRASSGASAAADRLRSGATGAVNNLRDNARQAVGTFRNQAADSMSANAESLRSAGTDAMRRAADRASESIRDDKWFELNENQRRATSTDPLRAPTTNLPSTNDIRDPNFVGPMQPANQRGGQAGRYTQAELDRMRRESTASSNTRFANTRTQTNESSNRGFGPSNFGMMPSGMSSADRASVEEERRRSELNSGRNSEIGFADGRLPLDRTARVTDTERQPFGTRRTTDARSQDPRNLDARNLDPRTTDPRDFRQDPSQLTSRDTDARWTNDPRNTAADRSGRTDAWPNTNNSSANTNLAADRLRGGNVDPTLSKADADRLPAGAWSFDIYDNPIDKHGRVLDRHGSPVSQQRAYELTTGRNAPSMSRPNIATVTGIPMPGSNPMSTYPGQASFNGAPNLQYPNLAANQPTIQTNRPVTNLTPGLRNSGTIDSASDRGAVNSDRGATDRNRQSVEAQPLFNGLLLISIVANVYLIFWLKNLRHQFHDLVASKRVVSSDVMAA